MIAPILTRTVRIIVWLYVVSGVVLLAGHASWFPDFYRPAYMGVLSFVSAAVIVGVPAIFKKTGMRDVVKELQVIIALSLVFNGLGELGLYKLYLVGFPYDKVTHFVTPVLLVFGIARFRSRYYGKDLMRSLWWAVVAVFVGGVAWEAWEWLSDVLFHTLEWGLYGEQAVQDTIWDVIMNGLGVAAGVVAARRISHRNRLST